MEPPGLVPIDGGEDDVGQSGKVPDPPCGMPRELSAGSLEVTPPPSMVDLGVLLQLIDTKLDMIKTQIDSKFAHQTSDLSSSLESPGSDHRSSTASRRSTLRGKVRQELLNAGSNKHYPALPALTENETDKEAGAEAAEELVQSSSEAVPASRHNDNVNPPPPDSRGDNGRSRGTFFSVINTDRTDSQPRLPFSNSRRTNRKTLSALTRMGTGFHSQMFDVLESDASSSGAAAAFQSISVVIILCSVVCPILQTLNPPILDCTVSAVMETSFDIIFLLELILRVVVTPNRQSLMYSVYFGVDVLAISGLAVRAACGFVLIIDGRLTAAEKFLLSVLPVIRFGKLVRQLGTLRLLVDAFVSSFAALPMLMYMLCAIALTASSALFVVESHSEFDTFPRALWFSIVTISTVGYGDITPSTTFGYIICCALVVVSVLFMAMPVGIIGNAFNESWSNRDRVLLINRCRQSLLKWGYTADEVVMLFSLVDSDQDGELEISEFCELARQMNLGLTPERNIQLFNMFDHDQSGSVDYSEFIRQIYPKEYLEIFNTRVAKSDNEEQGRKIGEAMVKLERKRTQTVLER